MATDANDVFGNRSDTIINYWIKHILEPQSENLWQWLYHHKSTINGNIMRGSVTFLFKNYHRMMCSPSFVPIFTPLSDYIRISRQQRDSYTAKRVLKLKSGYDPKISIVIILIVLDEEVSSIYTLYKDAHLNHAPIPQLPISAVTAVNPESYYHVVSSIIEVACSHCHIVSTSMKRCGKCEVICYCTRECQVKAWSDHRALCRLFSTNT